MVSLVPLTPVRCFLLVVAMPVVYVSIASEFDSVVAELGSKKPGEPGDIVLWSGAGAAIPLVAVERPEFVISELPY